MKRMAFLVLILGIIVVGTSYSVVANSNLIITTEENVYIAPNVEFSIEVQANATSDLVGFQMKITYDHTQFIFESLEKSDVLGNDITVNSNIDGELVLNYVDVSTLIQGDVVLFSITFTARDNVSKGSQAIISIADSYNNEFVQFTDGTIKEVENTVFDFNMIHRGLFGDVNHDDVVSIMDAAIIQLYIANLYDFSSVQMVLADVNGDGTISINEVALVQLYLAGLITSLDPS